MAMEGHAVSGLGLMLVVANYIATSHNKASMIGLALALIGFVVSLVELGITLLRFAP